MDSTLAVARVASEQAGDPTALILGIVGTVLSAFALGWNVYRDVLDDGRLRVRCYFGEIHGAAAHQGNLLIWAVTNTGRRAVVVQTIGGDRDGSPKHFILARPLGNTLPARLEPGQYAHFWADDLASLPPEDQITSLYAIDTLGRYSRATKAQVIAVREELRRIRTQQQNDF